MGRLAYTPVRFLLGWPFFKGENVSFRECNRFIFWSNYSALIRPGPPISVAEEGKSRLVKYSNLARVYQFPERSPKKV